MQKQIDKVNAACHGCQNAVDSPRSGQPFEIIVPRRTTRGGLSLTHHMVGQDEVWCFDADSPVSRFGSCDLHCRRPSP